MTLKYVVIIIVCGLAFYSCQSQKQIAQSLTTSYNLEDYCPQDGSCSFEILHQRSLTMKTDGIGALYPVIEKGNRSVLKFEYKRNQDPNLADDGYKEVIYAEIDSKLKTLKLEDQSLSKAKVYFGRLCFCRGQSGYFPVKQGELIIEEQKDSTLSFSFKFEIDNIPQVVKAFKVTQ
jgi:hypothetical protein